MSLIDKIRNQITAEYTADMDCLKHNAALIAAHERAADAIGFVPVCSVTFGQISIWLTPNHTVPFEQRRAESKAVINQYSGQYSHASGVGPLFLCRVGDDDVFVLGV